MSILRARTVTVIVVATAALTGCGAVGRYDEAPGHEVDLSGNWTINRTLSEDPKPTLAKLRVQPARHRWELPADELSEDDSGPPDDGGQQGPGGGGGRSRHGGQQGPQMGYRNANDAYTHSSVLKALMADIARSDNVTIQQTPERFSLDYGSTIRSFTPGGRSVVSAAWGVADQSSGWKGKTFVIQVRPQTGVASVETFSLEDGGKHLVEELRLGGGEFPSVKLKRVYDRSDHPVQRSVPMTD